MSSVRTMGNRSLAGQKLRKLKREHWFPAKRRGWGWGPPTVWQGWAVLVGILLANAVTAVVLLICSVKGEPSAWR